jgi:putative membrane protein
MRGFLLRLLITAGGLWLAASWLDGVRFDGAFALVIAALLLGIVNAIVRPIALVLTFPITLVTLGLFVFVINGAMLLIVAALVPAFHVDGWVPAILASIVVSITGWVANAFVGHKGTVEKWEVKDQ